MNLKKRLIRGLFLLGFAIGPSLAAAQTGNVRTTIVVPYPPGGASDTLARLVAERLESKLGNPVMVDYRPGGNHAVANQYVNAQPADGKTLYLIATPFSTAPAANPAVHKYHPAKSFTPIARLTTNVAVLVANSNFPANDVPGLIAYAKANPGKVQFSTTGLGSLDHLLAWRVGKLANVDFNIVHYKGSAQAFQDLMGGQVDLKIDSYASAKPALDSGRAKLLAVADANPTPMFPGLKTIDSTLRGAYLQSYFGVVGPNGMAPDVAAKLSNVLAEIIRSDDMAPRLKQLNMDAAPLGPEAFGKFMSTSYEEVQQTIKDAGIKVE